MFVQFSRFTVLRILFIAFYCGVTSAIMWNGPVQATSEQNWKGQIDSMPPGARAGAWVVRGRAFTAVQGATEFREDKGQFAVGVCVEVEYVGSSEPFTATKIASKNADDCTADGTATAQPTTTGTTTSTPDGTSTPDTTPSVTPSETPSPVTGTPTGTSTPDDHDKRFGLVEQMPTIGLVGNWRISGVEYVMDTQTRMRQHKGPFVLGACVEVEFVPNTTPVRVLRLETDSHDKCPLNPTPTSTPDGTTTATPDDTSTATPDGTSTSTPDGTTTATPDGTATATSTSTPTRVPGSELELYGILQSFPTGLIGEWNVGGMTFIADAQTEFKQERGVFTVGGTVKIHFSVGADGLNHAREIETVFANDHQGNDDDGNGLHEGAEGHAFGVVETMGQGLPSQWQISGINYILDANTRFVEPHSNFQVGSKVKIHYFLDASGARLVRKIKTTTENGDASTPSHFKVFGFVNQMPPNGLAGQWVVNNVAFWATGQTQVKADHGEVGLGAYVAVEYFIREGRNVIHEIETQVPPGGGDDTQIGLIDNNGGASNSAELQAAGVTATVWVIGGVSYVVTPATDLNDVQSELAVGQTALVNSYIAADGNRVATQIRGIAALNNRVLLPLALR